MSDDYALWAQIANAAAKKEVRPELLKIDDELLQQGIQQYAERQQQKEKKLYSVLDTDHYFGRPVLGKILILPRSSAQQFVYDKPWACISIATYAGELPRLNKVQQRDVLQLLFEDLEGCSEGFAKEFPEKAANMFTEVHAQKILEFVAKWWNDIDLLMVHCYAGKSRSPAVGKAISEIYQPEFAHYFDMMYDPNKLVYQTLKNTHAKHT